MSYKEIYERLGLASKIDQDNPPKTIAEVEQMMYDSLVSLQIEVANKLLVLSGKIAPKCQGSMRENDCAYLCKLSFLRQIDHMRAVIMLAKERNSDVGLIVRSMFEGVLQFFHLAKDESLLREWRLYACVVVARQTEEIIGNSKEVPEDVQQALMPFQKEIDAKYRNKQGKFHISWKKGKSIKDLCKGTDKFDYLYDEYYKYLSDYHHWGHESLAIHYQIAESENDVVQRIGQEKMVFISKSLNLALSCLFSMIEASVDIFQTGDEGLITEAREELKRLPFSKFY